MDIFDAHCDVLWRMWEAKEEIPFDHSEKLHVNRSRMKKGGVKVQTFAVFVPPKVALGQRFNTAVQMIDLFQKKIYGVYKKEIILIRNADDLARVDSEPHWGALLSLEGAGPLEGNVSYLRTLYQLGVRSVGLTWNQRNEAADGALEPGPEGLTPFGRELVKEMNRLGMVIDVSHLSEKSFWDVLEYSSHPVVASHSNCKKILDHPRNLTDRQIREMIRLNGVIGITFIPQFTASQPQVTVDDLLKHIDHICNLGGKSNLAFGSDFDGIEQTIKGLEHSGKYSALSDELLKRYSEDTVRGFAFNNWSRIYQKILLNKTQKKV